MEEEVVTTGSEANVDNTEETVELHQSTREDRQEFLAKAAVEEGFVPGEAPPAPTPTPEVKPQTTQQNTGAENTQDTVTPAAKPQVTEEEYQRAIAENEQLKTKAKERELFLQRRNSEFGELKKQHRTQASQLIEFKKQLEAGFEEKYHHSPAEALEDRDKVKRIDEALGDLSIESQRLERVYQGEQAFMRHVGNDVGLDDLVEVFKSDGMGEDFLSKFKADPFGFSSPDALVQLGKRAIERKALTQKDADLGVMVRYAKGLKTQLESLQAGKGSVVKQIQANLNRTPPMTAANGSSSQEATPYKEPHMMSRAERQEYLRKATA